MKKATKKKLLEIRKIAYEHPDIPAVFGVPIMELIDKMLKT